MTYTFATTGVLGGAWAPRIPQVQHRLGLGPGALGLALLALALGALVAMPLSGAAVARWGSRAVTRITLVAYCPLAALAGLAGALWSLWLALLCWGGASGALDVALNAQGVSVERARRRPMLSGFHAAYSAGALAGAGLGSLAAAHAVPVGWQQLGLGAAMLAGGLPLTRGLVVERGPRSGPVFAVPSGRLLVLGFGAFAGLLCEGAAADWSAVQLRDSLGASPGVAGSAFAAFSVAMASGRLVADRVTARLGRVRTVQAFAVVGALGLATGLATHSVVGAVLGFGALGAGLSCVVPVLVGAAGRGPTATGPTIAAVATCGYLGWLAGPAIIGALAQAVGLGRALWVLPVLTAAVAALASAAGDPAPAHAADPA